MVLFSWSELSKVLLIGSNPTWNIQLKLLLLVQKCLKLYLLRLEYLREAFWNIFIFFIYENDLTSSKLSSKIIFYADDTVILIV